MIRSDHDATAISSHSLTTVNNWEEDHTMFKKRNTTTPHRVRASTCTVTLIGGAFILAACAQPSAPTEPYRVISDQAEFTSLFVDKPITRANAEVFEINADGSVGGNIRGSTPVGTWEWKDGAYCRSFVLGSETFPYLCQKIEVGGTTAQFTRPDGSISSGWQLGS